MPYGYRIDPATGMPVFSTTVTGRMPGSSGTPGESWRTPSGHWNNQHGGLGFINPAIGSPYYDPLYGRPRASVGAGQSGIPVFRVTATGEMPPPDPLPPYRPPPGPLPTLIPPYIPSPNLARN